MKSSFILFLLSSLLCCSTEAQNNPLNPAITLGYDNNVVYGVDLTAGTYSPLSIESPFLNGVTLLNPTTALVMQGDSDSEVIALNLTTNISTVLATITGNVLFGAALQNPTTFLSLGYDNSNLYSINLTNGDSSVIATVGFHPQALCLSDPSTAIVVGEDSTVRRVNLINGETSTIVTITGGSYLQDIALLNPTTAMITSSQGKLYSVDLTTGAVTTVVAIPESGLIGVALLNSTTGIVVGLGSELVYTVNLINGAVTETVNMAGQSPNYFALPPQIFTSYVSGNNAKLAQYLNIEAPYSMIRLFTLQPDLNKALELAAPTRNAIPTFTAQTTQLLMSQPVANHLNQFRWRSKVFVESNQVAFHEAAQEELLASNQEFNPHQKTPSSLCKTRGTYTPWIEFFGDYAQESEQSQTASFNSLTGGFVAAFDYQGINHSYPVGLGVAYAHSYIHEREKMGHANTDQGSVFFYTTFSDYKRAYIDFAIWGGYYHTDNERHIVFPGFSATASSSIHGWQLAPHIELGYDHLFKNWFGIEPFMMTDWVSTWEAGFSENGAGVLNFGQKGRWASLLRTEAGFRFHEILLYHWGTMTIREKASYAYQKAFGTGTITAFIVGLPSNFTVTTLDGAQNLGVAEIEFLFTPRNEKFPRGSFGYQGEYGAKYQSHQAMIKLAIDF